MSLRDLLAELETLSKLKNNWYSVAETFEKVKKHSEGKSHLPRLIREACIACGYSLNTVNRMLAVREFFDSVKDTVNELDGIEPNTLSVTNLEVVKRLHQVSPKEGIAMLVEVATGRIANRDLRRRYNQVISDNASKASVQQVSKREGVDFEEAAFEAIHSASEVLLGGKNKFIINKLKSLPLFSIDAIAVELGRDDPHHSHIGFEFSFIRTHENLKRRFENLLPRLLFNANFFRAIWVVFPSTIGEARIKDFSQILDLLDYPSIGVAMLPWSEDKGKVSNGGLEVVRRPTWKTSPGWRGKHLQIDEIYSRLVQPIRTDEN